MSDKHERDRETWMAKFYEAAREGCSNTARLSDAGKKFVRPTLSMQLAVMQAHIDLFDDPSLAGWDRKVATSEESVVDIGQAFSKAVETAERMGNASDGHEAGFEEELTEVLKLKPEETRQKIIDMIDKAEKMEKFQEISAEIKAAKKPEEPQKSDIPTIS